MPHKFKRHINYFKKIDIFCKKNNVSKLELCLKFVMKSKFINKIIIGIDNRKNISDIHKINFDKLNLKFPKVFSNNKKLIDPRQWSSL